MVFTTHAVVGGALAKIIGADPIGAFAVGLASHYILDAIPHWEYSLSSCKESTTGDALDGNIVLGRDFIFDSFKFLPDLFLGLFLALHFFSTFDFSTTQGLWRGLSDPVLWGVAGSILPDGLQFLYYKIKKEPLTSIQKLHNFMHSSIKIDDKQFLGSLFQIILIITVILLFKL
ncbi:MAG: hypothetical protein CO184_00695 [Candidatus Zambryskibacteria bacterium CG_4_9_14_3_um_filter_40_16]|uniref:Uncharacterized protein n=2 Tax=Candidatus Zambryskiibacteriota TaxID=1817925 RepID=A0A2H0K7C5_9BACT|nr:MAG: hypothetical protein COV95_00250 [Candidatus Zambryskibacteria bacterium CG11_big_fil_rev_8_21_14_0_20_40_24]PJA34011.1 MAG: hypothetical protein CO184_00695 [Candidatus Zambryskibacteria bacterium CG_4_9_14_3_um_filter_40_16]